MWKAVAVSLACLAASGCNFGAKSKESKAPAGQVAATVDGDEITVREVRAELEGMTFPTPAARRQAEQAALQGIINRKLLAKAAVEAELDKTPEFAMQKDRMEDLLLAQSLQKKIVSEIPEPSREEAASFVSSNPYVFSERTIFTVDQIRIPAPFDQGLIKAFQPLKTMEEVEQLLTQRKIAYRRETGEIDALQIDPSVVDQIIKLPPGEPFVIPTNAGITVSRVQETRVSPFLDEPAVKHAQRILKQRRTIEILARRQEEVRKQAAGNVQYNPEYRPKPAPAAKPPANPPAGNAPATPPAKAPEGATTGA